MAYTATYTGTDLGTIFIDIFGLVLANLADNAPTIVILLIVALIAKFGGQALRSIFSIFNTLR